MATAGDFGSGGVMWYCIVHVFWTLIESQFLNMDTSVTDPNVFSTGVPVVKVGMRKNWCLLDQCNCP